MKYYAKVKPDKCPKCGSSSIGRLIFGEPERTDKLLAGLKNGSLILTGSACDPVENPRWQCNECKTKIYPDPSDKINRK